MNPSVASNGSPPVQDETPWCPPGASAHIIPQLHPIIGHILPIANNEMVDGWVYNGCSTTEEFLAMDDYVQKKVVLLPCGDFAFNNGHWPVGADRTEYLHPPARDEIWVEDVTTMDINSLSTRSEGNLPVPLAFIDGVRFDYLRAPKDVEPVKLFQNSVDHTLGVNGSPLRAVWLPHRISTAVEGWRAFFWFATDSRIRPHDIFDRLHFPSTTDGGVDKMSCGQREFQQIVSCRIKAFRGEKGVLQPVKDFNAATYRVSKEDIEAVRRHNRTQLEYGTWWTVDTVKGVMYQPRPQSPTIPWKLEYYTLPTQVGMSMRVQTILNFMNSLISPLSASALTTASPKISYRASPQTKTLALAPNAAGSLTPKPMPQMSSRALPQAHPKQVFSIPTNTTPPKTTPKTIAKRKRATKTTAATRPLKKPQKLPVPENILERNFWTLSPDDKLALLLPAQHPDEKTGAPISYGQLRQRQAVARNNAKLATE